MKDSIISDDHLIRPDATAKRVAEIVSDSLWTKLGNPPAVMIDRAMLNSICALAVQATINGAVGKWQS